MAGTKRLVRIRALVSYPQPKLGPIVDAPFTLGSGDPVTARPGKRGKAWRGGRNAVSKWARSPRPGIPWSMPVLPPGDDRRHDSWPPDERPPATERGPAPVGVRRKVTKVYR
jgi:hypothetical protein